MRTVGAVIAILVLLGTALFVLEGAAFVVAALLLTFGLARRLSRGSARDIGKPS